MYDYSEKKVVAVLASNLEVGIAMNTLGHMAIALGAYADKNLLGRPTLIDASGVKHTGIGKYPVIITKVKPGRLRRFIEEARKEGGLFLIDYPKEMLDTDHDDHLEKSISAKEEQNMEYIGAMVYGAAKTIQSLSGNFTLWK